MIKKNVLSIVLIVTISLIIILWIGTYFYFQGYTETERGTFGDMYGTVNALFSGLALAGIVFTILLQRNELSLQREELALTRREYIIQNDTLRLQRFENTFFSLLTLHHQIVNSIDLQIPFYTQEGLIHNEIDRYDNLFGRDVFKKKYEEFVSASNENRSNFDESVYLKKYAEVSTDFGHYFRNLYRMIKMVDDTSFVNQTNPKESLKNLYNSRYKYTSIIRSQLSDYELLWLFYNCLSINGRDKFKPLIEKYSIFKNLPIEKLIHKKHKELYNR